MSIERVILACERMDGHVYNGYIDLVDDECAESSRRSAFHSIKFRAVLNLLITTARENPNAVLYFMRLEQKPVPVAVQLSENQVCLIHYDPVSFIRLMDPFGDGHHKVDLRKEHSEVTKPQPIPAGYDTLADAFGEYLYLRRKYNTGDGGVLCESPISGRWVSSKDLGVKTVGVNAEWASVATKDLLESNEPRFFLPRSWNKDGPWISLEELQKKYDTFREEKNKWSQQATRTEDKPES